MKTIKMTGADLKQDNGSGYRLADVFPKRKFHAKVVYVVHYSGVQIDKSTIVKIERSRNGWN